MGFKTGKNKDGKKHVYNDNKPTHGSSSSSPDKSDGSSSSHRDYDDYDDLTYDQAENELKEYFNGFDYKLIKHVFEDGKGVASPSAEKIKLCDFDPDADEQDENKMVQVMFVGTQNHIYSDQLAGQTGEVKDEVFNDFFFYGKGNDIVQKNLGSDYTLYVRDEDVFFVKGL